MAELARVAHIPIAHSRNAGTISLDEVKDKEFEDLLLQQAYPPTRDEEIWAELVAPERIDRAKRILIAAHARTERAITRKGAELSAIAAECSKDDHLGKRKFLEAQALHDEWSVRATNFNRTVGAALAEINDIGELRAKDGGYAHEQLRAQLDRALTAIRDHKAASSEAGIKAEPHDIALWAAGEQISA